jgi:RIO kinase 1
MPNLRCLVAVGITCPVPHLLKAHVLIMDFLGVGGWCSPCLKDATLTAAQLRRCYRLLLAYMHRMFHDCNLVRGDLSEYNVLRQDRRCC